MIFFSSLTHTHTQHQRFNIQNCDDFILLPPKNCSMFIRAYYFSWLRGLPFHIVSSYLCYADDINFFLNIKLVTTHRATESSTFGWFWRRNKKKHTKYDDKEIIWEKKNRGRYRSEENTTKTDKQSFRGLIYVYDLFLSLKIIKFNYQT